MKFCTMVDLVGYQVFSFFGELWPRGKPPRSKIEKSITRSTVVSPVRQTWLDSHGPCVVRQTGCRMVGDGQCGKLFVFHGDRRSACGDMRQSTQLAYLLKFDIVPKMPRCFNGSFRQGPLLCSGGQKYTDGRRTAQNKCNRFRQILDKSIV